MELRVLIGSVWVAQWSQLNRFEYRSQKHGNSGLCRWQSAERQTSRNLRPVPWIKMPSVYIYCTSLPDCRQLYVTTLSLALLLEKGKPVMSVPTFQNVERKLAERKNVFFFAMTSLAAELHLPSHSERSPWQWSYGYCCHGFCCTCYRNLDWSNLQSFNTGHCVAQCFFQLQGASNGT